MRNRGNKAADRIDIAEAVREALEGAQHPMPLGSIYTRLLKIRPGTAIKNLANRLTIMSAAGDLDRSGPAGQYVYCLPAREAQEEPSMDNGKIEPRGAWVKQGPELLPFEPVHITPGHVLGAPVHIAPPPPSQEAQEEPAAPLPPPPPAAPPAGSPEPAQLEAGPLEYDLAVGIYFLHRDGYYFAENHGSYIELFTPALEADRVVKCSISRRIKFTDPAEIRAVLAWLRARSGSPALGPDLDQIAGLEAEIEHLRAERDASLDMAQESEARAVKAEARAKEAEDRLAAIRAAAGAL